MSRHSIVVNGRTRELDADEEMPLLWALRDLLGLTGTKFGCGEGFCGACTIHLDGAAVRSCLTTVGQARGREVMTIEGLAAGAGKRLVGCWIAEDVPQCGYCQTGQIMSAAALLARSRAPSDQEIERAMRGNICRCGTYLRIRRAIRRAAEGE